MDFSLSTYYPIFIYLVIVIGGAAAAIIVPALIAPKRRRRSSRCPMNPAWTLSATPGSTLQRQVLPNCDLVPSVRRGIAFLVSVGGRLGQMSRLSRRRSGTIVFWEVLAFLATVVVAYVYAWRKGVFRWR